MYEHIQSFASIRPNYRNEKEEWKIGIEFACSVSLFDRKAILKPISPLCAEYIRSHRHTH